MKKKKLKELNRITINQFKESKKIPVIFILDNIRSMSNIGAIFRISDAFILSKIYLCGITAKPPHREIHKTALGAEESMDWEYFEDIELCLKEIKKEYQIIGLEQTNESILCNNFEMDKSKKYAFIFGNEVEGISYKALNHCKKIIEIPQFGTKHSLNVSSAASIIAWESYKSFRFLLN